MTERYLTKSGAIGLTLCGIALGAVLLPAQSPPATSGPVLSLSGTSANVTGAPDAIRIDILRWSTDAERDKLMSAWKMTGGTRAPGGSGGPRGASAAVSAGRGGGVAGGRGGGAGAPSARGAGRAAAAPPATPEGRLAAALKEAPTVGYLWSSEIAGYALRYAGKFTGPNGAERIILITDRRLGALNNSWQPTDKAAPSTYDFSVIELRVNAKGEGEGKVSLTGKVAPDPAAGIITLENYDALPVTLKNLNRKSTGLGAPSHSKSHHEKR